MSGSSGLLFGSFRTAFRSAFQHAREQRSAGFRTLGERGHRRCEARMNPSKLDFQPRLKFHRLPRRAAKQPSQHCAPPHPTEPCPNGTRQRMKLHFLEVWLASKLRNRPQACAIHGRAAETYAAGGNGGGAFRLEFDHARERASKQKSNCTGSLRHRTNLTRSPFRNRNHRAPAKVIPTADAVTPDASSSQSTPRPQQPVLHLSRNRSSSLSGPSPPPRCNTRLYTPGLYTSIPKLYPHPCSYSNPISARLFHSSRPRQGAHHAIHAVLRVATLLKSAEALTYINLLFRVSVSLLPITLKRAYVARRAALASLAAGGAGAAASMPFGAVLFKILSRVTLALPFVLLGAVLLASLERTPITGRWRLLLLNDKEEQEIVQKVLDAGVSEEVTATAEDGRDWLAIMRAVLGEDNSPAGTLLGGKVLDSQTDWRAQLVESVLDKLEASIPLLAAQAGMANDTALTPVQLSIQPPPLEYPLAKHTRTSHLKRKNSVLVIDRPESNAFSFGFFGCVDQPEPGVIIVFTGAIDEILQAGSGDKHRLEQQEQSLSDTRQPFQTYGTIQKNTEPEPSWLKYFVNSILPGSQSYANERQDRLPERSAGQMTVSKEQEEALAVLLAHELAHLVLSHTIESYASTTLLWPQLEKLGWDMLRVVIYPITAILGPFVQDAISATVKVGIEESEGLLPALTSSCESRKLEHEADIVALRLLANAGIDPRSSLDFWEERLSREAPGVREQGEGHAAMHDRHAHAHSDHANSSFVKTHPADEDRIAVIRKELARWQNR